MSTLTELAEKALLSAKKIDAYLAEQGLASPSYEDDTLVSLPPQLAEERDDLVNTSNRLRRLALGTHGLYWQLLFNFVDELSLRGVYLYDLASHVPLAGTSTFAEIGRRASLPESLVERIMRHAMSNGIFTESSPGHVRHTAASSALATDPDLRAAVGLMTCEIAPACSKMFDAIEKWPSSGEPDQTAFTLQNEPGVPIYTWLAKHPDRARRFGAGMRYYGKAESGNLKWLIESYAWNEVDLPDFLLVDVGGGQGTVPRALASSTKNMKFLVQDLADTARAGREALPEELSDRIDFMEHDFFTTQPIQGADIYFFRWILHNWSDKYCIRILQALIPALRPGAKVMVYEHLLKDGPETRITARRPRDNDLIMLAQFNALERTWQAWQTLFKAADARFQLEIPHIQERSAFQLIVANWVE